MPEGDTVWLVRERLAQALVGKILTRSELRVPRHATANLTGRSVQEIVARGKHLLTRFSGGDTLHTHLMLDGMWHITQATAQDRIPQGRDPQRRPRFGHSTRQQGTQRRDMRRSLGGPAHEIRVILANAEWQAIGFRLHQVRLLPTSEEHRLVGHLGPDILGADWDRNITIRNLSADPDEEIGIALLDQRKVAGIGNCYKTESLYLAGITPWSRVGDVPDLGELLDSAKRLMWANRYHPEQSTTGSFRPDESHWVFERPRRPCLRCGTPVAVDEQGTPPYARLCYWCPVCQQGPSPLRHG